MTTSDTSDKTKPNIRPDVAALLALSGDDSPVPDLTAPVLKAPTSGGSTGRPKAVVVPHRALVNHMDWALHTFPIEPSDVILHRTPIGFDASVWEIWGPLLAGCPMVLARQDRENPRVAAARRRLDRDPVAHGGEIRASASAMPQPSGDAREHFLLRRQHPVDVRVLEDDASGHEPLSGIRSEGGRQALIPADL